MAVECLPARRPHLRHEAIVDVHARSCGRRLGEVLEVGQVQPVYDSSPAPPEN